MNKILKFFKWLFGPTLPIKKKFEIVKSDSKDGYTKSKGTKSSKGFLKLIKGKKK